MTTTSQRSTGRVGGERRRLVPLIAVAALSPLALAACSSSSSTATTTTTTTTTTSKATATTATTSAPSTTSGTTPQPYEVKTGTVSGLGTVLVDGQGLTLYLFVPDKQSGTSTCYSTCAQGWPPLILPTGVAAPVAGAGVQSSLLGTTHRTDGTTQITYNKWPLYLWQGDSEPGQATGQGLNNEGGLWYVLSPDGHTITTRP
jgi:predicted lipoprotein with Yx(FWY)xxD motif